MDILSIHNQPDVISARTTAIHQAMLRESQYIKQPNFDKIEIEDLARLFELYDEGFFDGWLTRRVKAKAGVPLKLRLSSRMTRAGGKTTKRRRRLSTGRTRSSFEIAVASRMLFMTFRDVDRPVAVCGLTCKDRLEALQRIMEHEVVHLGELLASLDAQTHTHWRLIARDDGSDDRTTEILDDFATDHGDDENETVRIIRDDRTGLGARGNFAELLTHAAAPYVMFCDQDDVWLPTKVETTLAAMIDAEAGRDPAAPVLVHTDLRVVDASLQPVCESLWAYQRFDPVKANRFARTVVQNVVTGCTVMINAALATAKTAKNRFI